jgi:hypothetical protein
MTAMAEYRAQSTMAPLAALREATQNEHYSELLATQYLTFKS